MTSRTARGRLGHGRLPARSPARRRGGGTARRAVLHVLRGCGFLRSRARQRRQGVLHPARARSSTSAAARGATRPAATAESYRRSQLAFYRKHHPGWAPFLKAVPGPSRKAAEVNEPIRKGCRSLQDLPDVAGKCPIRSTACDVAANAAGGCRTGAAELRGCDRCGGCEGCEGAVRATGAAGATGADEPHQRTFVDASVDRPRACHRYRRGQFDRAASDSRRALSRRPPRLRRTLSPA